MNRGRSHEEVFPGPGDYRSFLELLEESAQMWNVRIGAYCMMPNHYHLLLHAMQGISPEPRELGEWCD